MDGHGFHVLGAIYVISGVLTGDVSAFLLESTCDCPASFTGTTQGFVQKTYTKLGPDVDVVNPGRGFYTPAEARTSNFYPVTATYLGLDKNVVFRMYYLDTYLTSDLDTAFTDKVKTDLKVIQDQGWTVILRFAYLDCCVDPPYRDPSYARMLSHIRKLDRENVFREYEGIIVAIQAGFVGVWGEWHFTTSEFGIPGSCSNPNFSLSDSQWAHRKGIVQAVLDAAPPSVEILVRIPAFKFHLYDKVATTMADEKAGPAKSRIGFHNDAFLSDLSQNQGTFLCADDRSYMAADSLYNYVTGETDDAGTPAAWTCANAEKELAEFHYSSLNSVYLQTIIQSWKQKGCYDVISAHLGYRLYLTKAILPSSVKAGGEFCYHIEIRNEGYAAPNKEMQAHIVLENTGNGAIYGVMVPGVEVRAWLPGNTQTLIGTAGVPAALPLGQYKVHFVLLNKVMGKNSKYFVLMANANGVQNTTTRMNNLGHIVDVTSGQCNSQSAAKFQAWQQNGDECAGSALLLEGSFEHGASGWHTLGGGYNVITDSTCHQGNHCARIQNGGVRQTIDFSGSPVSEFKLSAFSRHQPGTSVPNPDDYSIFCDIQHVDGSSTYGLTSQFDPASSPNVWHFRELHVALNQPIAEAWCYGMFRNSHGVSDFDSFQLSTCTGCGYKVADGSFETGHGWSPYNHGFVTKTGNSNAQDGNHYITVTNGGAYQDLEFNVSPVTSFELSGWSRAHGASVSNPADYSIYCDLTHADNTVTYGKVAHYDVTRTSWNKVVLKVHASKVIRSARCYAMFRNSSGSADFDNFRLESCA